MKCSPYPSFLRFISALKILSKEISLSPHKIYTKILVAGNYRYKFERLLVKANALIIGQLTQQSATNFRNGYCILDENFKTRCQIERKFVHRI